MESNKGTTEQEICKQAQPTENPGKSNDVDSVGFNLLEAVENDIASGCKTLVAMNKIASLKIERERLQQAIDQLYVHIDRIEEELEEFLASPLESIKPIAYNVSVVVTSETTGETIFDSDAEEDDLDINEGDVNLDDIDAVDVFSALTGKKVGEFKINKE